MVKKSLNLFGSLLQYISEGAKELRKRRLEGAKMNQLDLENFMESCGQDILSFCKYLTKNREEAEDLCQDTFVQGFEMRERIADEAHAKKFFLSIAVQLWKNRKRKYAWRRRLVNDQIVPMAEYEMEMAGREDTPEELAIRQEQQEMIRKCVDSLPENKRLVVLLYYMEDLKEREIAEVLGLPVGTVKSRLHQAKTQLAAMISKRL